MDLKRFAVFQATKAATRCYSFWGMQMAVQGLDHIPKKGGAILVSNHRSMIDGPLIYGLLDRMVYSLIKKEYFAHPFMNWYLRSGGGIPVQNGSLSLSAIKDIHWALAQGEMLLVFPEGRIHEGPGLLSFSPTFVRLARRHRIPIVPIVVRGSEQAFPNGAWRWIPRPATIHITIHRPIVLSQSVVSDAHILDATEAVRRTISETWLQQSPTRTEVTDESALAT